MSARDPVAAARVLLEKVEPGSKLQVPSGRHHGAFPIMDVVCEPVILPAGLLGELVAEVERLREAAEINRVRYESAELHLGDLVNACVRWRGATGEMPEDCWEAYVAARSGLAWPFETREDRELLACLNSTPDNPWPGHPVIEPDPAEAAQAEERARIEAAAREEAVSWAEAVRREAIDDAIDRWHEGAGEGKELHEYLGMTWKQYARFVSAGEIPEGWEPPAGLAGEGE